MKIKAIIIFITAAVLIIPAQSQAEPQGGKINFGNLAIIPGVEMQGIYDDNIYLKTGNESLAPSDPQSQSKESDFITHAKPSLLLNYTLPERGSVGLGYRGDFAFYRTNDKNNWKSNQGTFNVNYLSPGGLIVGIDELYSRSEDPFGSPSLYGLGQIKKRWTNTLKTKLGYNFTTNFRTILFFNNSKQKYQNDEIDYTQNWTDNDAGLSVEARFLPKTWGFVRYHSGKRQHDTRAPGVTTDEFNADYTWNRASAGVTWDADAKMNGEVNFGYEWRKPEHEFTNALHTARRDDKNSWVAATMVNFRATETTNLSLTISRALNNTASDSNEQFTDTSIGLNLQQKLLTKLSLTAGLTYGKNDYNIPPAGTSDGSDSRSDTSYTGNTGLYYDIQEWLGVGIGYKYARKDSNYKINEYVNNQVMATLKIAY